MPNGDSEKISFGCDKVEIRNWDLPLNITTTIGTLQY